MAGRFPPPPTYTEPIQLDEFGHAHFNPIWLKWFVDLVEPLGVDGTPSATITDTLIVSKIFGPKFSAEGLLDTNVNAVLQNRAFRDRSSDFFTPESQYILVNQIFGP